MGRSATLSRKSCTTGHGGLANNKQINFTSADQAPIILVGTGTTRQRIAPLVDIPDSPHLRNSHCICSDWLLKPPASTIVARNNFFQNLASFWSTYPLLSQKKVACASTVIRAPAPFKSRLRAWLDTPHRVPPLFPRSTSFFR